MLLRSSIANTRKFFHKTLQNFKSFFSPEYQRLPKTPQPDHFSYSVAAPNVMRTNNYEDLEKFYANFTEHWDSQNQKPRKGSKKKTTTSSPIITKQEMEVCNGSFVSLPNSSSSPVQKKKRMEKIEEIDNPNNKRIICHQRRGKNKDSSLVSEQRNCILEKKLRELEMLDVGNVDHVMDIEEVLHYYSRLTCPAYLEVVEKFFMEMYSEFFGQAQSATPGSVNSRLKHRSVRS